ncbi:adhesion G-protein coupled receptor G2-like, partial [Musca vetustissima]|uniref:adhesion G-protein coupled receptor G2-like n=1 Tax=Musca vetustissima TaxID=27455 RepID=UPI002AB7EF13
LPENVTLIFRDHQRDKESDKHTSKSDSTPTKQRGCGLWNYESWAYDSYDETPISNDNNLILCKTRNTVSFGALIGLDFHTPVSQKTFVLRVLMDYTLDVISIVGCCLSLFGLVCIWITAICCKKWREQSSNRLLLNICFVLTLLMSYFLFINLPDARGTIVNVINPNNCIAEGAFLQYIILVLFLWMFFLAILQYERYIVVMGIQVSPYRVTKFALAAWSLPLIPTALVVYFDSNAYIPEINEYSKNYSICYPKGLTFYLALLLPISIICLANFAIFIYIIVSVQRSLGKFRSKRDRKLISQQLRLSILLFFLLGISWLFGLLAHLDHSGVLAFLFCITATIQGFVLFIYFVVIDKTVKFSWLMFYCGGGEYILEEEVSTR